MHARCNCFAGGSEGNIIQISLLENYSLYHVTGRNLVGRLVFVPYILTLLLGPRCWADQISYAFIFAQWFVVGFVVSLFVCKNGRT